MSTNGWQMVIGLLKTVIPIRQDLSTVRSYWSYLSNDNSYWFENMAYLRLKNVTLNYMLPQTLTKKVGVSRADLFFSGYNLFMLYSAQNKFDAEVADPESYPTMKTYSIGVKVTF
jgi:hypothetical protein